MDIFSNQLISISSNPSSVHLYLFLSLRQFKFMSTFLTRFLSHSTLHLSASIFFYLSCQSRSMVIFSNELISITSNPSSVHLDLFLSLRQSKFTSIFLTRFLSHSILHLSTSIFSISLLFLIHVYLLQFPLFHLVLSFIYQRQTFSIFLPIWSMPISPFYKF